MYIVVYSGRTFVHSIEQYLVSIIPDMSLRRISLCVCVCVFEIARAIFMVREDNFLKASVPHSYVRVGEMQMS